MIDEATAKRMAEELGVELPPATPTKKRAAPRKRNPSARKQPVTTEFLWSAVDPITKLHALFLADQDIKRLRPVSKYVVVVLNQPQKEAPR